MASRLSQRMNAGPIAVSFDRVTFGYGDSPKDEERKNAAPPLRGSLAERRWLEDQQKAAEKDLVLRDITFRLEPGRVMGLLGRTGQRQDHPHAPALPPL